MSRNLIHLEVDLRKLDRLARGFKDYRRALASELKAALVDTLTDIERVAKEKCPVKTGRLRASITTEVRTVTEGYVGTNVEYAADVEYGTHPHTITAKNAKTLRFERGGTPARYVRTRSGKFRRKAGTPGKAVFAKSVQHPGTPAQPYLEPAYRQGEKMAKQRYEEAFQRLERLVRA